MNPNVKASGLAVGMLLGLACVALAQEGTSPPPQNQVVLNSQDQTVKMVGRPAKSDDSGKPLDEQKSAPVQVLTREYDLAKLSGVPRVSESEFRGRILWVQKCAFCHDGFGQPTYKTMGPWLDQEVVTRLTDVVVKILIQNGTARMPAFRYGLSLSQQDDILTFLKTVPASAAPTPAQLAGRSEGGASSD